MSKIYRNGNLPVLLAVVLGLFSLILEDGDMATGAIVLSCTGILQGSIDRLTEALESKG